MFRKLLSHLFILLMFFQTAKPAARAPQFTESDLIVLGEKIYHIALTPEQLAPNIILVGDPERVPFLAEQCLVKPYRADVSHRGLRTITGETEHGVPVSIVTSGMGTPSLEIVINELMALNEIDLQTRCRRDAPLYEHMNIIRLGTSGGLQESTRLGTPIISAYAIGFDNTGLFYDDQVVCAEAAALEASCVEKIEEAIPAGSRFAGTIKPYAAAATSEVVDALREAALEAGFEFKLGITISNAGFFANQGRDISGIRLTVPDVDLIASTVSLDGLKVENMEMESSFIFHYVNALNHRALDGKPMYRAGAVCPAIANRRRNTFAAHYEEDTLNSLRMILRALETLSAAEQCSRCRGGIKK